MSVPLKETRVVFSNTPNAVEMRAFRSGLFIGVHQGDHWYGAWLSREDVALLLDALRDWSEAERGTQ